jgi:uncharacterized protein
MLGIGKSGLKLDRARLGPIPETFVYGKLVKMLPCTASRLRMFDYRDEDKVEVDFVLEDQAGNIVGIEVKAAATALAADFRGLCRLAERADDKFQCGILLYDDEYILPFGKGTFAVSVSALWTST